MSQCAICGYNCTADDFCAGCNSFVCPKHVYNPGAGPHTPSDHTADENGRRPGE
jgi:hypothetical protein